LVDDFVFFNSIEKIKKIILEITAKVKIINPGFKNGPSISGVKSIIE